MAEAPSSTTTAEQLANEAYFTALVAEHQGLLHHIAGRIVGPNDAEDVVQTALLKAWQHWETFDSKRGSFGTWTAVIAANAARKFASRHQNRMEYRDEIEPNDQEHFLSSRIVDPFEHAWGCDKLRMIGNVAASLNKAQQQVFTLLVNGSSIAEIAKHMDISEGNARVRVHRVRTVIRTLLSEVDN